jgi:thiosulfate dehydrogenase [quinone] large subunit
MSGPGTGRRSPAHRQSVQTRLQPRSDRNIAGVRPGWGWLGPPPRATYAAGWALLPLRCFLGFTFCFAGLQKLANPQFFDPSSPVSIQAQLSGAARLSPVHALVSPLVHVAVPLGLLIALAEIAVGFGTLIGLWTRVAAIGGLALSLMLFLTVSFHASPYYTGSDVVFVFAWTALLIAGSGGVLSADALIAHVLCRRADLDPDVFVPFAFSTVRDVCGAYDDGLCQVRRGAPCEPAPCPFLIGRSMAAPESAKAEMDRRTFAAKGAVAAVAAVVAVVGGGVAAGVGRLAGGPTPKPGPSALGATGAGHGEAPPASAAPPNAEPGSTIVPTTTAPTTPHPPTAPPTTSAPRPHPPGQAIGAASRVPVGGAGSFNDPNSGDPSVVIQPRAGTFVAFDAVCPHAGCIVQYDAVGKVLVCPCHGSRFNADSGAVEQGPAATGLQGLKIVEGSDGQLYVA